MEIRCNLEYRDDEDLEDPYGEILFIEGERSIIEQDVFLYEWLEGMITGLKQVQTGKLTNVDLINEPYHLVLEPMGKGLGIRYKDNYLYVESITEFERALRVAARDFLNKIEKIGVPKKNSLLDIIRAYAAI